MNSSAFDKDLDPTAAIACDTSETFLDSIGRHASITNSDEIPFAGQSWVCPKVSSCEDLQPHPTMPHWATNGLEFIDICPVALWEGGRKSGVLSVGIVELRAEEQKEPDEWCPAKSNRLNPERQPLSKSAHTYL